MKAQCARCKDIVELRFALADGGIDVTCPACGAGYFVAASAPAPSVAAPSAAAPAAPPEGGETVCPKCQHAQPPAESCRRCGLVFARWKGPASTPAERGEGTALWFAVEAAWADERRHEAFLSWAQRAGELGFAAARYRTARTTRDDAEPQVTRALERIERLALSALAISSERRRIDRPLPYRNTILLVALAVFLAVGGLVWASAVRARRAAQQDSEGDRIVPVLPKARPTAKPQEPPRAP